jgi:hypothetical protein
MTGTRRPHGLHAARGLRPSKRSFAVMGRTAPCRVDITPRARSSRSVGSNVFQSLEGITFCPAHERRPRNPARSSLESDGAVTRAQVVRLQSEMAKLPQVELATEHYFADGMYCRESSFCPKDTLIVGKVPPQGALLHVVAGTVKVTTDDGVKDHHRPGMCLVSPGHEARGLRAEDCTCLTVTAPTTRTWTTSSRNHRARDGERLFDAQNKLIHAALETKP